MRKNWLNGFVLSIGCVLTIAGCASAIAGSAAASAGSCASYSAASGKE